MEGLITVKLWGTIVGYLAYSPNQTQIATFEYDEKFLGMGVSPSPILLPTNKNIYEFDDISQRSFRGLPGFIADSLPDTFGNQLIDMFFADKGIQESDITALDRLLYVADRSMGALEYEPSDSFPKIKTGIQLDISTLSELAELTLNKKSKYRDEVIKSKKPEALGLLRIGSSAGGARAKALVAIDKKGKLYDGTIEQNKRCKYYLLKFDVDNNKDKEGKDPKGMPRVEYIYSLIAKECGINMPSTEYIEIGDDFHFLIERFDRFYNNDSFEKLHYVSWCGMKHYDRDTTGAYSYEQLVMTARELGLPESDILDIFRRAVFNIVGRNQDDHTKNFGFLMDKSATWSLSPAFDMTYSYDPSGKWTRTHQIMFNNKRDNFTREDIIAFGAKCNLSRKTSLEVLSKTIESFKEFGAYADEYKVPKELKETVMNNLRIEL